MGDVGRVARNAGRTVLCGALVLSLAAAQQPLTSALVAPPDWQLVTAGPFSFRATPYSVRRVPVAELPMEGPTLVEPYGTRDASGVVMYRAPDGSLENHPVAQAQYVVNMLRDYRLTADEAYLDAAIDNANRLLDRAARFGGALFFPYPFDYALDGRGVLRAPWYSGMAQGTALSGFVRLFAVTGDPRWRYAADATFASFLVPRTNDGPWFTTVDRGLLWFEEYPWEPADHTFNGHVFALYGLYDYWRLTGDARAELLVRGGLAAADVAASLLRVPGGVSRYCLSVSCIERDVRNPQYQRVHVGQFRTLYRITGIRRFDEVAGELAADVAE